MKYQLLDSKFLPNEIFFPLTQMEFALCEIFLAIYYYINI